jgi:hypothetical protein
MRKEGNVMSKFEQSWVREQVLPLGRGAVVQTEIPQLSLEELVKAYAILDQLLKRLETRKDALRAKLLQEIEVHGTQNDKGGFKLRVEDVVCLKEKREGKVPEREPLLALLQAESIAMDSVFDAVTIYEINPSKIEHLVSIGKLQQDKLDALKKVTWALKVTPGADLLELLDEAMSVGTAVVQEEEVPVKRKRTVKK